MLETNEKKEKRIMKQFVIWQKTPAGKNYSTDLNEIVDRIGYEVLAVGVYTVVVLVDMLKLCWEQQDCRLVHIICNTY